MRLDCRQWLAVLGSGNVYEGISRRGPYKGAIQLHLYGNTDIIIVDYFLFGVRGKELSILEDT